MIEAALNEPNVSLIIADVGTAGGGGGGGGGCCIPRSLVSEREFRHQSLTLKNILFSCIIAKE